METFGDNLGAKEVKKGNQNIHVINVTLNAVKDIVGKDTC
jgi:hypothetical protein